MNAPEQLFSTAQSFLLAPHDLEAGKLAGVFGSLLSHRLDYADLYFQYSRSEGWSLEEGIVKSGSFSIDQAAWACAITGEDRVRVFGEISPRSRMRPRRRAARSGGRNIPQVRWRQPPPHQPIDPLVSPEPQKGSCSSAEQLCRARDPRVIQVMASLAAEYEVVLVARSDGVQAADVRPLVRLSVHVIVEQNGRREQGTAGGGGRSDYGHFTEERLQEYAKHAVDQALVNLESRPAPAGTMTVVLGPGWPGILLHEAIGHGLEGDFNRKGSSAFAGKIERKSHRASHRRGRGTMPGRRGRFPSTTRQSHTAQYADRGRRCAVTQDNPTPDGRASRNGRRGVVAHVDAAHDQHLHERRQGPRTSSPR
jgi:TldD protein